LRKQGVFVCYDEYMSEMQSFNFDDHILEWGVYCSNPGRPITEEEFHALPDAQKQVYLHYAEDIHERARLLGDEYSVSDDGKLMRTPSESTKVWLMNLPSSSPPDSEYALQVIEDALGRLQKEFSAPLDARSVTEIVVSTLFKVYESKADLQVYDLYPLVEAETGFDQSQTEPIITFVFNKESNPYLLSAKHAGEGVQLATFGLWLIEDSFMHSEETIDSMQVAEDQVVRAGFLKILS
jgi:hypothetical protein